MCAVLAFFVLFTVSSSVAEDEAQLFGNEVSNEILVANVSDAGYIFQDRIIERLDSLIRHVDVLISEVQSEKVDPPLVQLLKGMYRIFFGNKFK